MLGKNKGKKIGKYKAGIIIIITIYLLSIFISNAVGSCEVIINKETDFIEKNSTFLPNQLNSLNLPLTVKINAPKTVIVNKAFEYYIEIFNGLPPFNVDIKTGDGNKENPITTEDRLIPCFHMYMELGTFIIIVWVNDSSGQEATTFEGIDVIQPTQCQCDLKVVMSTEEPWYPVNTRVRLDLTVESIDNFNYDDVEGYIIFIDIPSCNETRTIKGGPISPGTCRPHTIYCCHGCAPNIYTPVIAIATIEPINCTDINPDNDVNSCKFFIFPKWLCEVINNLPGWLQEIIEDIIGNGP